MTEIQPDSTQYNKSVPTASNSITSPFLNYQQSDLKTDEKGHKRGEIEFNKLKELWFQTGTQCNLACTGCFEASSPTNKRLLFMTLEDVIPYIGEGLELGAEKIAFTGGEPFLNQHFPDILDYSMKNANTLVLTNGTKPFSRNIDSILQTASQSPYKLEIRISLDSLDEDSHNAIRDPHKKLAYNQAVESIKYLAKKGHPAYIAGRSANSDMAPQLKEDYKSFFEEKGIPVAGVTIFNEFDAPQTIPTITPNCMSKLSHEQKTNFMCTYLRQVVKKPEGMRVIACTVTNDHNGFDYGPSLKESLTKNTVMAHHRCLTMCYAGGASCSTGK